MCDSIDKAIESVDKAIEQCQGLMDMLDSAYMPIKTVTKEQAENIYPRLVEEDNE